MTQSVVSHVATETRSAVARGALSAEAVGGDNSQELAVGARPGPLFAFCSVSIALLGFGGWLTSLGIGDWYYKLEFPPFQPPAWVFTPAWTAILALLAIASWRVAQSRRPQPLAFSLYGAQCVLNVGWSLLFFTARRPDLALAEIVVLDVTLAAMVVAYGRIDRISGVMLTPYLLWLLFATAINGWIVSANEFVQAGS